MVDKEIAVFGGGCFWCTEAVFKMLKGVASVLPGYAGGEKPNPTYLEVCSGNSGHVEVTKIEYDPAKISFRDLLTVFFATHDPTTLNRQGNDVGTQYRSVVFYTTLEQKKDTEQMIREIDESAKGDKVVTKVVPFTKFYEAEEYHRDYFARNPEQSCCRIIINPKIEKVQAQFAKLLETRT